MDGKLDCQDLIKKYVEFLSLDFSVSEYTSGCRIMTPFWRPDGDHIEIFVIEHNNLLVVTDEGQTIDWLFSVGMDVQNNRSREDLVYQLAKQHGINFKNGIFSLPMDAKTIGVSIHRFLSALMALSNLTLLRQQRGKPTFRDEVEMYLLETGQNYKSNYRVRGKTIEHTIPIYLNSNRNWLVEPVTATSLSGARTILHKVAFEWIDIQGGDQIYETVTLVDDSNEKWEEIWSKERILLPLETYSSRLIRWSQRTQLLNILE